MKWTETFLLPASSALELDVIAHDLIDGCALTDVLNILISYTPGHVPTLASLAT